MQTLSVFSKAACTFNLTPTMKPVAQMLKISNVLYQPRLPAKLQSFSTCDGEAEAGACNSRAANIR